MGGLWGERERENCWQPEDTQDPDILETSSAPTCPSVARRASKHPPITGYFEQASGGLLPLQPPKREPSLTFLGS